MHPPPTLRTADRELRRAWERRFASLPRPARDALAAALRDLRADALARAAHAWSKHKAPMALYWKVVGVYAGHIARAVGTPPLYNRMHHDATTAEHPTQPHDPRHHAPPRPEPSR